MAILINFLLTIHVVVSLLIVFVVLMQRPKSEGLGAAFGGGMTDNLFGAQTTNVLATFTRWLGGIFFAMTLMLAVLYSRQSQRKSAIQEELRKTAPPVAAAAAAPSASPIAEPSPAEAASSPVPAPTASDTPAATPAPSPAAKASPSAAKKKKS